jgi:uncharacterized protein YkwD
VKRVLIVVVAVAALAVVVNWQVIHPQRMSDPYLRDLAPASTCPGAGSTSLPDRVQLKAMFCLINYARVRHGRRPLPQVSVLDRSAGLKAAIIASCGEFSHTPCGAKFRRPFVEVGYARHAVIREYGENLAWGAGTKGSPRETLDQWLNSPEHRQNLLQSNWQEQGISLLHVAHFVGYADVELWVSHFGRHQG